MNATRGWPVIAHEAADYGDVVVAFDAASPTLQRSNTTRASMTLFIGKAMTSS